MMWCKKHISCVKIKDCPHRTYFSSVLQFPVTTEQFSILISTAVYINGSQSGFYGSLGCLEGGRKVPRDFFKVSLKHTE